jgi:hypothetical protein
MRVGAEEAGWLKRFTVGLEVVEPGSGNDGPVLRPRERERGGAAGSRRASPPGPHQAASSASCSGPSPAGLSPWRPPTGCGLAGNLPHSHTNRRETSLDGAGALAPPGPK